MAGEVNGGHVGMGLLCAVSRLGSQVSMGVEVGDIHLLREVVSGCTEDAVGIVVLRKATAVSYDGRWCILVSL